MVAIIVGILLVSFFGACDLMDKLDCARNEARYNKKWLTAVSKFPCSNEYDGPRCDAGKNSGKWPSIQEHGYCPTCVARMALEG